MSVLWGGLLGGAIVVLLALVIRTEWQVFRACQRAINGDDE